MTKLAEFLPPHLQAELKRLAAMPDSEIDCADIPEQTDWNGAERGRFKGPPGADSPPHRQGGPALPRSPRRRYGRTGKND